jgi:hypothetical protein
MLLSGNRIENSMIQFNLNDNTLRKIRIYVFWFFAITCLYHSYFYPYFDMSDRRKMVFQVDSKFLKGVYTTKERATVINELLAESKKYIKKNDVILAYDCIPMVHFLTETRPYLRNPWPGYYFPQAFQNELKTAYSNSTELPVIVTQKLSTIGSNWPQNKGLEYKRTNQDLIRDSMMVQFLKNNTPTSPDPLTPNGGLPNSMIFRCSPLGLGVKQMKIIEFSTFRIGLIFPALLWIIYPIRYLAFDGKLRYEFANW